MEHDDRGSRRGDVETVGHAPHQHACAKPVIDVWMRSYSAFNYLLYLGGVATLLIWTRLSVSGNARDGFLVVGYALAAVALIGFVRSLVIEVAFEPEGLIVRNPLRTRHVAWSDIVEVARVSGTYALLRHVRLRLRDGSTVSLRAVAATWGWSAYRDHVATAERLRRDVEAERAAHGSRRRAVAR